MPVVDVDGLTFTYASGTRRPAALLESPRTRLVSEYSKGMKTRLGVARALLNDPRLIFLDEPTAGLDPASGRRIRNLVREMKQAGRTVFLTTHDMTVADELCDRVAFIVRPRPLLDDRPGRREFPLDGLGENADFLALLRAAAVRTLHTQEATLEDVFLRVTGQSLQ